MSIFLVFLLTISLINCEESMIRNTNVYKSVDLKNQVVTYTEEIEFENVGSNPIHGYKYVLDPVVKEAKVKCNHRIEKSGDRTYWVRFQKPILPNFKNSIKIFVIVIDELPILNSTQSSHRLISFDTNFHYYSAYKTVFYEAVYELNEKGQLIEIEPKLIENNSGITNRKTDLNEYSYEALRIVYINDVPFYYVNYLERKIDVSHFGFISVEDRIHITNRGPKPKNPFENSLGMSRTAPRTKLHTILPELAFDVKLFDEIGNNSKSQLLHIDYDKILAFETRYELLVSWKSAYTIRYSVPAYPYLRRRNDTYVLRMPLVDNLLPFAFVRNAKTMVFLPSDADLKEVDGSDVVWSGRREYISTALAPNREVVIFDCENLVNGFTPDFYIMYDREAFRVFKPAFYIIGYIEVVFLGYLFISYTKPMFTLKQ